MLASWLLRLQSAVEGKDEAERKPSVTGLRKCSALKRLNLNVAGSPLI